MDAQAIVLILGGIGGIIGASFAGLAAYKKATAPHSALLGLLKALWYWLDFTEPSERIITKMKAGGSIASGIPDRVKGPVVRVVYTPQELREHNRRAGGTLNDEAEEADSEG